MAISAFVGVALSTKKARENGDGLASQGALHNEDQICQPAGQAHKSHGQPPKFLRILGEKGWRPDRCIDVLSMLVLSKWQYMALTRLGARTFLLITHLLRSHNQYSIKVRAPRRVSASEEPNVVSYCHLDKTTMDNSSRQLKCSWVPVWVCWVYKYLVVN